MSESALLLIQPGPSFNQRIQREYELRFVVHTHASGRADVRYFASPHDWEGLMIGLSTRERLQLLDALESRGFHAIMRDDGADQLVFSFEPAHLKGVAA